MNLLNKKIFIKIYYNWYHNYDSNNYYMNGVLIANKILIMFPFLTDNGL